MKSPLHSWKAKIHPLFLESVGVYSKAVKALLELGPQPPREKIAQIESRYCEEIKTVRMRYADAHYTPTVGDPLDTIWVDAEPFSWHASEHDMNQGLLECLHWMRFREPFSIALHKEQAGDMVALRRIQRAIEDHERLRFGKGPIKAPKTDLDHDALFVIGLDLGLNELTDEELADCFDAVCPCGKSHDADALDKQRDRKKKELQKARDWLASERAKMPSREWMTVYGSHDVCAKAAPADGDFPPRVYVGEIGKRAACFVDGQGDLFDVKGKKLGSRSLARKLPHAFFVSSPKELFVMFFLAKLKGRKFEQRS
jgi:hypothetical protein